MEKGTDPLLRDRHKFIISTYNVPILDLTVAMDFVDGAGVILLGSCGGEISVIQFIVNLSQIRRSFLDNLPPVDYDLPNMETVRLLYTYSQMFSLLIS